MTINRDFIVTFCALSIGYAFVRGFVDAMVKTFRNR
jgi:hypothetical protein